MSPRRTSALAALGVAGSLTLTLTGITPAHATDPATAVPTGVDSSKLPGAQPFGDTDPGTQENVTFVLKMNGQASLAGQVTSGMTNFLSVEQFATRYAPNQNRIDKLVAYLRSYGLTTTVYADHIAVNAKGTAAQFDAALHITQKNLKVPAASGKGTQVVHTPKAAPVLPQSLANMVTAVLGLDNYSPFTSQAHKADASLVQGTDSQPSTCPVTTARLAACHLPGDFAKNYGLSKLYTKGADGSGQTIGIVTLAALDQGAAETFWKDYGQVKDTGRTVTVADIDGGPGAPSAKAGSDETDLDVEQSGGVAPGANVKVYQAPNSDAGWADAFFTAASENIAGQVSASWGFSETVAQYGVSAGWETPALQSAYDEVFLEMAAQGQSTFLSSADQGAYVATNDLGSTNLSVDAPANSPYVTSAGGTTTPWKGALHSADGTAYPVEVTTERAWGWDYLWEPISQAKGLPLKDVVANYIEGGGGGYSTEEARPSYQQAIPGIGSFSAVQYLTPTDYLTKDGFTAPYDFDLDMTPSVTHGTSNGRVEPDLSADADPMSGYLLYSPSSAAAGDDALQAGWGGTSFVAPQFNGSTAVMAQSLGHRVGLWNPALYRLARTSKSPVTPINTQGTSNDNLYYTGTPGTLFNPAVGLGTPDLGLFTDELR